MADEPKEQPFQHPLEKMFEVEDQEIQKLVEGQGTQTETAAGEAEAEAEKEPAKEPIVERVEPEKEPAAAEAKPEAAKPPVEEKPEVAEQKNATWKMVNELRKQNRELEKQLAERELRLKQAETAPIEQDPEFEDPIAKIQAEQQVLKQQLAIRDAQDQQRQLFETIDREESAFEKDHPDYRDAMRHLVQTRREEYEALGILNNAAVAVMQNAPEAVDALMRQGKSAEDAARDIAFAHLINQERMQFIIAAKQAGKTVPQAVYEIAQKRGWQGKNGTSEPLTRSEAQERAAQERVRQTKESIAGSASLSAMQNTGAPKDRKITKRSQLLELDKMDPNEAAKYIDDMDRRFGPGWVQDLE